MLAGRNQVTIVGSIGTDARITQFENGAMVARFSVAVEPTDRIRTDNKEPELFRMFAWGNTAQFIRKYCDRGNKVAVTGRLVNRTYVNPQGLPRRITEVEVRQVVRL
jgi:single-strand DNA-binding protein